MEIRQAVGQARGAGGAARRESRLVTLRPTPTTTQARLSPCQRASQRIPPSFRSSTIRSLGHLSRDAKPRPDRLERVGHRQADPEAEELHCRRRRGPVQDAQPEASRRRPPGPAPRASPRGLLAGDDHGARRRAVRASSVERGPWSSRPWRNRSSLGAARSRGQPAAGERAEHDAVPGERREAVMRHVPEERLHDQEGREEGDDEPDGEERPRPPARAPPALLSRS